MISDSASRMLFFAAVERELNNALIETGIILSLSGVYFGDDLKVSKLLFFVDKSNEIFSLFTDNPFVIASLVCT